MKRAGRMIVTGTCAAGRTSSRLQGSRGNTAFWRPVTLHWRRSPRIRVPHRENRQAVSWTSIFAPQILQHFSSNLTAAASSTLFATTISILKPLLTQCSSVLHHRETRRTYFSRERLFSRSSERHSSVARVDLIHASLPRRGTDVASSSRPSPFPRTDQSLAITTRSNTRTTRVSNTVTNHTHHSASSVMMTVTPTVHPRESRSLASRYSVESPRIIQGKEMVWRQPPPAMKIESQDVRRSSLETPQRSRVPTFNSPGLNNTTAKNMPSSTAPNFDAAQMDRFVDNVIGRVEKRMRIERERRGW
jgi:hypothetical protein